MKYAKKKLIYCQGQKKPIAFNRLNVNQTISPPDVKFKDTLSPRAHLAEYAIKFTMHNYMRPMIVLGKHLPISAVATNKRKTATYSAHAKHTSSIAANKTRPVLCF